MTNRRKLVIALGAGAGAFAAPPGSFAQTKGKVWRVGFFYTGTRQSALATGRYTAFLDGMRELGYIEGKNLVVEERFAPQGEAERIPGLATELLRSNLDVIVTGNSDPLARVLRTMDASIPIVFAISIDPVRQGFAASLARPGGNFTGLSALLDDIFPKHVEFLKTAMPSLSRIAVLSKSSNASHPRLLKLVEDVALKRDIKVLPLSIGNQITDIEQGFGAAVRQGAQAVIILGEQFFVQHFRFIADLAIKHRLASIYSGREYPDAGGLMSYGPNFADNFKRAAAYVDKILKGAKPGDLPIEQPTRLYLTINRQTAKTIGLTISPELLLRADAVIE